MTAFTPEDIEAICMARGHIVMNDVAADFGCTLDEIEFVAAQNWELCAQSKFDRLVYDRAVRSRQKATESETIRRGFF